MKRIVLTLALVAAACEHTQLSRASSPEPTAAPAPAPTPRSELMDLEVLGRWAKATLCVTNHGSTPVVYDGYSAESPLHQVEVEGESGWATEGRAWCGTGVQRYVLEPRDFVTVKVGFRADGRRRRFVFGRPQIRTEAVVANPK